MINKSIPFKLTPIGKSYIWGGERLKNEYNKHIDITPLAETWECSIHKDGITKVGNKNLKEVLAEHPEYLGKHSTLPIMIKFIDAKEDLSIQVHPNDIYAKKYDDNGKDEMWYILDSKDSYIVNGLKHNMTKEMLLKAIKDGNLELYLQKQKVHKNEVYYIKAGTIHAIGKGCLIVEIQESSNLTYRLYDYDRIDVDGNKRELHIENALDVAILNKTDTKKQQMRVLKYKKEYASELIVHSMYFNVERYIIYGNFSFESNRFSFEIIVCIDGEGKINDENIVKGDCFFVPAGSGNINIIGNMQLLKVCC